MKSKLPPIALRGAGVLSLLALLAIVGAGCGLTKPNSASFASVEIKGSTPEQIRTATIAVFQEDGFSMIAGPTTEMVFQQEGSRMNKFAYGDWVGGGSVFIRVRSALVPLSAGVYRLQCTAFMVTDAGSVMEEEQRLANVRSRPYQRLLDRVEQRLKDSVQAQ